MDQPVPVQSQNPVTQAIASEPPPVVNTNPLLATPPVNPVPENPVVPSFPVEGQIVSSGSTGSSSAKSNYLMWILYGLIGIFLIVLIYLALAKFYLMTWPFAEEIVSTPVVQQQVSIQTPIPSPLANSVEFTSSKLGISFNYSKSAGSGGEGLESENPQPTESINNIEVGNKVFVYSDRMAPEDGQYVEVFSKDPKESLVTAIKSQIIKNASLDDCIVQIIDTPGGFGSYPPTFQAAEISLPLTKPEPKDPLSDMTKKLEKCPVPYTRTNGISYFLTDNAHPDKFVFFSIGQYPISSGDGTSLWQNTLRFIETP